MPVTGNQLVSDAMLELGVIHPNEGLSADLATFGLGRLNLIVDTWNAERDKAIVEEFNQYTFTPSLSPHTIGPTGATFTVSQRPVRIDGASVVLNTSTPNVLVPITVWDYQWWNDQTVPDLETDFPTDLYYEPAWPNGKLFFWPVPTVAYGVELVTAGVLSAFALNTSVSLPPGYQSAYLYTLAEDLCNALGKAMPVDLPKKASKARARIGANNVLTPRLQTQDSGMPTAPTNRSEWNYLTGLPVNGV